MSTTGSSVSVGEPYSPRRSRWTRGRRCVRHHGLDTLGEPRMNSGDWQSALDGKSCADPEAEAVAREAVEWKRPLRSSSVNSHVPTRNQLTDWAWLSPCPALVVSVADRRLLCRTCLTRFLALPHPEQVQCGIKGELMGIMAQYYKHKRFARCLVLFDHLCKNCVAASWGFAVWTEGVTFMDHAC